MNNPRYKKHDTSNTSKEVLEARAKLKRKFGNKTRLGGKGTIRRKKYTH